MKKNAILLLLTILSISPFYGQDNELNIIVNRKSDIQKAEDFTSVTFYLKGIDGKQAAKLVKEIASYSGMVTFTMNEMGEDMDLYKGYMKFSSSIDFNGLDKIFVANNIKSYTVEGVKKTLSDLIKIKGTANGKVSQ